MPEGVNTIGAARRIDDMADAEGAVLVVEGDDVGAWNDENAALNAEMPVSRKRYNARAAMRGTMRLTMPRLSMQKRRQIECQKK